MKVQIFLEAGIPPAEVAQLGRLAEDAGIAALWTSSFPARREPFMCLAALAAERRNLQLGAVPISPYELHPLKIADTLLTLNELCGGRGAITVGGMGHSVMRVTGLTPVRRVSAVRECVEILHAAAAGEPVSYEGEIYWLQNYHADWLTQPAPKIYVGANGPGMLKMAGRVADAVMLSDVPLARMAEVRARMLEGRAAAGRETESLTVANFFAWHIKEDRQAALDEARMELIWRGLLLPWHTAPFLGAEDAAFVDERRDAFLQAFVRRNPKIEGVPEHIIDALIKNLTFTGSPADIDGIAAKLSSYAALGLDEVTLKIHGDAREAIRLIGTHLIPALP
ncbi:MAG: LLM class flavin-dependent oxidoreductase [Gammaproteobacteria bacterium]|jgi:alkanesulfonate monooxygenase SsuD/methylene tetrahydromethanopterin reductase-like flavin-dependent oxidoreductase (luciferase family)